MIMFEKMFVIVGAFLCGYCIGYYSFEIFKYENRKDASQCKLSYEKDRRN